MRISKNVLPHNQYPLFLILAQLLKTFVLSGNEQQLSHDVLKWNVMWRFL